MCIICVKKPGIKLPDMTLFERCFKANPDGAGYMYPRLDAETGKAEIVIRKGFMRFEDFAADLRKFFELYGAAVDAMPMVLHFRIGTHGSQKAPEHTHPFPIIDDYGVMEKTNLACSRAMAHNGIYSMTGFIGGYGKSSTAAPPDGAKLTPSDSMEFAKKILAPLSKLDNWLETGPVRELIGALNGTCRLAIMDTVGAETKLAVIGDFVADTDGMLYSNSGFKVKVYSEDNSWNRGYYDTSWYADKEWDPVQRRYVAKVKDKDKDKSRAPGKREKLSVFGEAVRRCTNDYDEFFGTASSGGYARTVREGMLRWYNPVELQLYPTKYSAGWRHPDVKVDDKNIIIIDDPELGFFVAGDGQSLYFLDEINNALLYVGQVKTATWLQGDAKKAAMATAQKVLDDRKAFDAADNAAPGDGNDDVAVEVKTGDKTEYDPPAKRPLLGGSRFGDDVTV